MRWAKRCQKWPIWVEFPLKNRKKIITERILVRQMLDDFKIIALLNKIKINSIRVIINKENNFFSLIFREIFVGLSKAIQPSLFFVNVIFNNNF